MKRIIGLALLLSTVFATEVEAKVVAALSCNQTDVQNALKQAANGDIVTIPAGTCTWTTPLYWTAPANTTVQGAGIGSTIIIDDVNRSATDEGVLIIQIAAGNRATDVFQLTGITFRGSGNSYATTYNGSVRIGGTSQQQQLRLHHCYFDNLTIVPLSTYGVYGVIDHSTFDMSNVRAQAIKFYGENDLAWANPTALGSNNFLFVEDNTFIGQLGAASNVQDGYEGARFVIRHNTLNSVAFQTHPTGGSGRSRGVRAWEIYENIVNNTVNQFNFFFLSSGTGVIWGHSTVTGYTNFVTAHSMRRNNGTYPQAATPNGWGYCGTSFNGAGSAWDQNSTASTGYACLDQPGRGVGDLLSGQFPDVMNNATGCKAPSPCAWPRQALEPVYEWSNTWSGSGAFWVTYESDVLVQNRDYYLRASPFTGETGTGTGLLSARPATCTPNVAYWATDTRTLYRCSSLNTWSVYYTPYTYPHPLVSGSAPSSPNSPTGVIAR
jgi:hypothetical protein